jgi:hypothetical protein
VGSAPQRGAGDGEWLGRVRSPQGRSRPTKKRPGLTGDIQALADTLKGYPWKTLAGMKGDRDLTRTLEEAEKLLKVADLGKS